MKERWPEFKGRGDSSPPSNTLPIFPTFLLENDRTVAIRNWKLETGDESPPLHLNYSLLPSLKSGTGSGS